MSEDRIEMPVESVHQDDPTISTTIVVGLIGVFALVIVVAALEVLYYRTADSETFRKHVVESEELERLRSEQLQTLEEYRWVDRERGILAIPIERAMELVVEDNRKEKSP